MKKRLNVVCASALLIFFLVISQVKTPPAKAGTIYSIIVGLAQQVTQFAQLAEEIGINTNAYTEVAQQVEQLAHEVQIIEMMITNLEKLADDPTAIINTIEQLVDVVTQGQVLSYAAADIDEQYAQMYPGYEEYRNNDITGAELHQKYIDWSRHNLDNIKAALKAAHVQEETLTNERDFLRELKAESESAEGRMAILQSANRLAAQEGESLLALRELAMVNIQLQANWMAKQQDLNDIDRAHTEQVMTSTRPVLGDESNILDDFN